MRERKRIELILDRLNHSSIPVSQARDRSPTATVKIFFAASVEKIHALAAYSFGINVFGFSIENVCHHESRNHLSIGTRLALLSNARRHLHATRQNRVI
jgi:hypothetical protein